MNSHDPCIRITRRRRRCAAVGAFAACIGALALSACTVDIDNFAPRSSHVFPVEQVTGITRIPLTNAPVPSNLGSNMFGAGGDYQALTFVVEDVGYGPNQFYYLRNDSARGGASTFGTISTDGTVTDRFRVGNNFDALTFTAEDVGYGPNLFYYLRHDPAHGNASTFGTLSAHGDISDRFVVGAHFDALAFAAANVGYGPSLFYYLRHDPARDNASTFGTISPSGSVVDRFEVGKDFEALTFVAQDIGFGELTFYYLRRAGSGDRAVFGTITPPGAVVDRFRVGNDFDALTFTAAGPAPATPP